jgi:hypothetical protein
VECCSNLKIPDDMNMRKYKQEMEVQKGPFGLILNT